MKNFDSKFTKICEDTIYRFQSGGIIPGDLVKFRKDVLKNDKVKTLSSQYQEMIKSITESDLNLRVGAVKSTRPSTTQNYSSWATDAPYDFFVDVVVEYAPGLWRDPITVPIEVLERVDTNGNLAPVPKSLKREQDSTKPEKIKQNDSNRSLSDKNVAIPGSKEPKDGRKQTQKPKKFREFVEMGELYETILEKNNNQS